MQFCCFMSPVSVWSFVYTNPQDTILQPTDRGHLGPLPTQVSEEQACLSTDDNPQKDDN